jgi:hypothetical protein
MAAAVFYTANSASLQIVAENAVRTAAEYLPMEPAIAVRIAVNYAETGGIAPDEIVLTKVAGDDRAITLFPAPQGPRLRRLSGARIAES